MALLPGNEYLDLLYTQECYCPIKRMRPRNAKLMSIVPGNKSNAAIRITSLNRHYIISTVRALEAHSKVSLYEAVSLCLLCTCLNKKTNRIMG